MTRTEAAQYLTSEFKSLEDLTLSFGVDHPGGYKSVIDSALRQLGVAEADIPTADVTAKVPDYLKLLDYYALRRYWRSLSAHMDIEVDGVPIKRSQAFAMVKELLSEAETQASGAGLLADPEGFELGTLNLDYLEPAP